MLPTCARWTAMTRFFVLSRMTRNTSRSSSWMKRLATQNASSGDVMCVVSSATSGSRTSWRIRVISTSVVSFMEKLLSRVGCSPTRCRPVDGNVASVARRRKGDRRGKSKKADSAPGRRLPKPASEKRALSQNAEEDEERQRLFLMALAPMRSELEYGNRTACGPFPSDRAVPLCSMPLKRSFTAPPISIKTARTAK